MLAQERRNLILERLQEEKSVVVGELSQQYSVSEETIRRDLDKLEKDGYATKSYGGAVLNESVSIDLPFNVRKKHNISGKQRIAELAAAMVENGDRLFLDASTTAVFIAKAIREKKNLTVITNSLEIMIELSDAADCKVISPGGSLREGYLALTGPYVVEGLRNYHVDKAFISSKSVSLADGASDSNEDFALAKRVMLQCATEKYLAVDTSKMESTAFARIAALADFTGIITDACPAQEWLNYGEAHNLRYYYP